MSIARIMRSIYERLGEHERRLAGSQWVGKVTHVDTEKHLIRIALGKDDDGGKVLSPWVPVAQVAGALKLHSLPSVGQVMAVRSEAGDIEQGVAEPYHWTEDNPSPSDKGDEHIMTFGDVRIELRGDEIVINVPRLFVKCGGTTFELTGGGLKAVAPDYQWD
jgi:hypothetical protein